jgi:AcrR family transcriptional regulator
MDDVARELGISKKTLYEYTKDKTELVDKIIAYEANERDRQMQLEVKKPGNAVEQLNRIMRLANMHLQDYSPVFQYDLRKYFPRIFEKMKELSRKSMYAVILENLKNGKKEGLYRKEMQEEIIARLHLSRLEKLPEEGLIPVDEYVSKVYFHEIFQYHVRGLANEKGLMALHEIMNKQEKESVK